MLVIANCSAFIISKFHHCMQVLINNLRYFHSTECTWFHDLLPERSEKRNSLPQGTAWTTWGIRGSHAIFLAPDLSNVFHEEALFPWKGKQYLLFTFSLYQMIVFSQDVRFPGQVSIPPLGEAWAEVALWLLVLQWEWTQWWWDGCRTDVSKESSCHDTAARGAFLALLMVGWQRTNDMDTSCQEGCK